MKCLPTVVLPSPLSLSTTLHLAKLKLYPLNTDSLCPVSLQSVVSPIALSVSELDFSRYPTEVGPWDTCPFMSGLFHFAQSKMFSVDANVKMGNFLNGKRKKVKSLSRVRLFASPWTIAHQSPLSMGFSRQEYWSGLLFPSPGDLPNSGTEPESPVLQADALLSEPPGKPLKRKGPSFFCTAVRGCKVSKCCSPWCGTLLRPGKAPQCMQILVICTTSSFLV